MPLREGRGDTPPQYRRPTSARWRAARNASLPRLVYPNLSECRVTKGIGRVGLQSHKSLLLGRQGNANDALGSSSREIETLNLSQL